ncbi:hypothetical protein BBK36DRAFT_1107220 [Trichoderma citrinoviride]|uniref:FAR1 domain-containing protein n=1 Tax=Trichoderma citrinoviride TaxID=58853 RepID=A0A2T4BNL8_9HYPO|nr:hypothetical protein BBK36DRAFT_1107220 [Trichoderma citrinoviride]PTB70915.1 hypothetical protein BBK36DRAFT_1107220 [Trichoderma citrinoviride]
MDPVFSRSFETWEAAVAHVKEVGKANGYDLVIHSKRPRANNFHTIIMRCGKGRPYISWAKGDVHESKRRKTTTQKTGCPYRIKVRLCENKAGATAAPVKVWCPERVDSDNAGQHNHPPLEPGATPGLRKDGLSKKTAEIIFAWKCGIKPPQILKQLQNDPDPDVRLITRSDVYNLLRRHRRDEQELVP